MRPIYTIDSETDPFRRGRFPRPFLWGVYDGSAYWQFEKTADVVEFARDTQGIFYAHNGGRFDYHFLLEHAENYTDTMIIAGRLAKWKLGAAEFRDSFNILPVPLKAYKKDDFDYTLMEREQRDKRAAREKIEEYLKHDCMYLHELVTAFRDQYGFHLTQASASMSLWRKQSGFEMPETDWRLYDHFKPYYYGGRVQAFRMGHGKCRFQLADVKSAYPRAMLEDHPIGAFPMQVFDKILRGDFFYRIRARANGCFPKRGEDGRLTYPVDHSPQEYSITGWELIAAERLGLVKDCEVMEIWRLAQSAPFKDYILGLYEDRKQAAAAGDHARKLFDKLLMNSLYGKFGADPRKYCNYFIMDVKAAPVNDPVYELSGYIGKWALIKDNSQDTFSKFYCVATSASITGFQRAVMLDSLTNSKGLVYCDTDSIAAEHFGELDTGIELGQWEIFSDEEGGTGPVTFDEYYIGGRKLYAFYSRRGWMEDGKRQHWKTASKGVRLSVEQIKRVALGETVLFEPEIPTYSLHNPVRFINREISQTE